MNAPDHVRPSRLARSPSRRLAVLLLALFAVLLVALSLALAACGGGDAVDDPGAAVVARVNGESVTQSDVDDVRAESRLAGEETAADAALDEAIGRELVRQEAARLGLAVTAAAIDARVAEVAERAGGEEALAQALREAEMSAEQLRRGAEYGLLRGEVRDTRFADVSTTDAAVRRFYRRNVEELFTEPAAAHLGMIVVRTERLGDKVADELADGAAFADLARMYTRDPESKESGGDLGWIALASLPEVLGAVVEGMAEGEVAGPVQGPGGWYVLELRGRRPASVTPFAEVEDDLRQELDLRRRTRALDRWIEAERARAEVVVTAP
jgi:parvulin-like peptidyl-prolyl isomerase